jgi:hypothetical protein
MTRLRLATWMRERGPVEFLGVRDAPAIPLLHEHRLWPELMRDE